MKISNGTRVVKTRLSQKKNEYELLNNRLGLDMIINETAANILRKIFLRKKISKRYKHFINELNNSGIIEFIDKKEEDVFICDNKKIKYPLSAINLELTNSCNLKCIHCYGSFGNFVDKKDISYEWLENQIMILNELSTQSISLTGGESTCNKSFVKIAKLFLKSGFDVCIFTNSFNLNTLNEFINSTKAYKFRIKISLDGFKEMHDYIRGVTGSFDNAYAMLKEITNYDNIELHISSIIMRENIGQIQSFKEWIKKEFPNVIHNIDLIFPEGNGTAHSFCINDFESLNHEYPEIFKYNNKTKRKGLRCSGGVSQITICSNGDAKICNSACDPKFYFKHNVYQIGIKKTWLDCGKKIKKIRKEKQRKTKDCIGCSYKSICNNTDCRVSSLFYTGEENRSNPITCFITRKEFDAKNEAQ